MDYNPDYYEFVLSQLAEMYAGYDDYYYDLVYSLDAYELILFYEQVCSILNNPTPQPKLSLAGDTSHYG